MFQALLAKLCEGTPGVNANNGIISGVLVTVGDLARVVGDSYILFYCSLKCKMFDFLSLTCICVGWFCYERIYP